MRIWDGSSPSDPAFYVAVTAERLVLQSYLCEAVAYKTVADEDGGALLAAADAAGESGGTAEVSSLALRVGNFGRTPTGFL